MYMPRQKANGKATRISPPVFMTGKQRCEMMKRIRMDIAEKNGIELAVEKCTFKGECPGFCPKCDGEALYLDAELKRISAEGKEIILDDGAYIDFLEQMRSAEIKAEDVDEKLLELSNGRKAEALDRPLCSIDFSRSQKKHLQRAGIDTLAQLADKTKAEIAGIKGLTPRDVAEIELKLRYFHMYGKELKELWQDICFGDEPCGTDTNCRADTGKSHE